MSEVAKTTPTSELALRPEQTFWTEKQEAALRQLSVHEASKADLAVFFHQVTRTGLDPFARQIYMIKRDGKQTIQTGIDGYRLIARRAVDARRESLAYEDTLWCGADGEWADVWLADHPPSAAKVTVLRNGYPFSAVALFHEYAGRKRDGEVNSMWQNKGTLMLAKCAEALALRKAFPQELSGIYTSDEMHGGNVVEGEVVEKPPEQAEQDPVLNAAKRAVVEAWQTHRGDFAPEAAAGVFGAWSNGEELAEATAEKLDEFAAWLASTTEDPKFDDPAHAEHIAEMAENEDGADGPAEQPTLPAGETAKEAS